MTVQRGADGYDAFYRATWPRLAGTLRLLCEDRMIADETAQEALVRAWERWDRVAVMDRPEGWVYVTAFRLLRRRLGRERRRPVPLVAETATADDVPSRVELRRALAALPIRQRQAVVARHVLGHDGRDGAELLGVSEANFRQLCKRGLDQLRVSPALVEEP